MTNRENDQLEMVSVVIPTYNRFKYLLNSINSVKSQTYKNIEIIVVNDKSIQKEYYEYDFKSINVKIIHLEKNTKEIFGYPCAGYVRNMGIKESRGKYIAFLDDDDIWFSEKIEKQIKIMKETGCKMSSTEGIIGRGEYNQSQPYEKYNSECHFDVIKNIYLRNRINFTDYPNIWTYPFLKIHNCVITSSVLMEKELLEKINNFNSLNNGREDYDCWMRALKYTSCAYIKDVCFYYDARHGDGQNY